MVILLPVALLQIPNHIPVQADGMLVKPTNQSVDLYAVNSNILRIMSGMAGLAYSN
jgi:hypothetical protein